jgi:HTH-type transcriptional regulator/antitoxin HigA
MNNEAIAQAFPPGEFIKEELEARGWTQSDLAKIMGRQNSVISAIVNGKRSVSPEVASELASAFGTTVELWMNLQASYDRYESQEQKPDVSRRAKLFAMAPINDMIRRGWIRASDDLNTLEREVADFLCEPISAVSFHKSSPNDDITPAQRAWLCQARKIARGVQAAKFSHSLFSKTLEILKRLLRNPEDVTHVARVLAEGGVRFLIIESLPGTKIDGACFWLDKFSPVIVMTMRYDRIDNFWYVLSHECGHVKNEHGIDGSDILDINLVGDERVLFADKTDREKVADRFAAEFLIKQSEMEDFVDRLRPAFSKQRIRGFAIKMGVHPGIVVGQLMFREEVGYFHSREMLVKVRDLVTKTALTDGFGHMISINT